VQLGGSFQPQENLAAGWKGFDRDLGAKKREERAQRKLRRSAEGTSFSVAGLGSLVVAVAVAGGAWWLWSSGKLSTKFSGPVIPDLPTVGGLPSQLKKEASDSRKDLALLGRSLLEFASDAQHKFGGDDLESDVSQADVDRYRDRLRWEKETARKLEPQLTREERRVLMAFEHAIKMLDGYLTLRAHNELDVDDARIRAVKEQIERALAVARGEKVENVIVVFSKKISESAKRQKEMQDQTE
jgi:hypothetical protein